MITPAYARAMAAYNAEMNRDLYEAATTLTDGDRRQDRKAFWRSIHGTLSHLMWADRMWMSRLAGWPKPEQSLAQSAEGYDDFETMTALRREADVGIEAWAAGLEASWFDQDLVWFSGAAQRELRQPRSLVVMHLFNHQTHHRGQLHAMLTAAGVKPGDTDLPLVLSQRAAN